MIEKWKKRPFSWSQISQWEYDKDEWYKRYILGERSPETGPMKFGKEIGERLASDQSFMPEVPRLPVYEYKLIGTYEKIPLIGYIDAFSLEDKAFIEFKTGKNWDKKKAESHGQIDLYCALLYAMHKIRPEELDIRLVWLATEENGGFETQFIKDMKPMVFPIKKTMVDVLNMLARVKRTVQEMEEYILTSSLR